MKTKKRKVMLPVFLVVVLLAAILGGLYIFYGQPNRVAVAAEVFFDREISFGFASEDGLYHTNSTGFLYFFDSHTRQDVIVCNKPNCAHKAWSEDTPDEQRCNAYLAQSPMGFVLEDSLYIMNEDFLTQTITIIQSGLDRTGRKEVAQLEGNATLSFVVKDHFLYTTGEFGLKEKDENGMEIPSGEFETWLLKVDLRNGEVTNLTERKKRFNGGILIAGVYGDRIYCTEEYFEKKYDGTNYKEANHQTNWYTYEISTGKLESAFEDQSFENIYLYGNKMVSKTGVGAPKEDVAHEFKQYQITVWDLDTGVSHSIVTANELLSCVDGKIFYTIEEGENQRYYYYNMDNGKTVEMSRAFMKDIHLRGAFGEYLCVIKNDPATKEGFTCLILKSDFFSEKENYIPLVWKEE